MTQPDIAMAKHWASLYRLRGMNPLPSRPDAKRPVIRYADLWDKPLSADEFDRLATTNIQVMTGRFWRLLVIDLDGSEAKARWAQWGRTPDTWITHSGGGGWHLWFRLPEAYPVPLPKAFLWRGDGEHQAIERLCDQSLVMAPPSIHPKTGERYRFLDTRHSPRKLAMPADCPAWVLRTRPITTQPLILAIPARMPITPARATEATRLDRDQILDAVRDKIGVAQSWGVRFAGRPSPKGWVPCHAIGRDDQHPSAAVHKESGLYVDKGSGLKLSFFDLGVQMGIYRDWRDAATDLEAKRG